nr:reverse transcriptase domain-containing protein [Tanacetum cinerariifolium]
MRTRSSSNLPVVSSNPSTSNAKRCNRGRSKQPFILEESPIDTMADQRTMAELVRAPTEGYKDLLRACPHHGFTELHQLDTFCNALNPADQDSLNATIGGNLLEIRTQDVLTIIENKSKQTSAVTTAMTAILKQFPVTPHPASVKAVEEICVTYGGAHPYYQCLAACGNTFPELRDNIQGYVSPAAVNYNQGLGSLPSNTVANPKDELKAITNQSSLVLDGPTVPTPSPYINPKDDKRVEETLTDPNLSEYTIKVPPPPKLPEKLRDPKKFLIPYGFVEFKCKALANSGASINLIPLSVWKKLGLPKLISTRMTLELANRTICTPAGIARDVFVSVGNFTFTTVFVNVDYESDSRVPLILGRPFLWTARALIDVHGEEMILQGSNVLHEKLLDLDSTKDLHPPLHVNPLSGSITYCSSPNPLLEELADELALIDIDSNLKDSIDQSNLANPTDNIVDSMHEMFTDENALDYSSPLIFDEYDDDLLEVESDVENVYNDPFDSKGEKIKESKLLIDELDLPCDFLPFFEYDSFISQDFSRVDAFPSTNNEDKIFNPGILSQENPFEIITSVVQDKKLAISNASLVLEDFDPPLYEPLFLKEVPRNPLFFCCISSIPRNLKTHAEGFCPPVFISSASSGNHPGHLAVRLGCAEMKVTTWDDLAFKVITLGWNVKHENFVKMLIQG